MTWNAMLAKLKVAGVRDELLPAREPHESALSLRSEHGRFIVSLTERGETEDVADFADEDSAVDFIYDREVITFRLFGDRRFDQWNEDRKGHPLPTAEQFGGRTLRH